MDSDGTPNAKGGTQCTWGGVRRYSDEEDPDANGEL